jgi:putative membrane protein
MSHLKGEKESAFDDEGTGSQDRFTDYSPNERLLKSKKKTHFQNLKNFFLTIAGDTTFISLSLLFIGVWSAFCAYVALILEQRAEEDPDGSISNWLVYIENGSDSLKLIGSLFSFALIFRFSVCYDRWWQGRQLWGGIITHCLDLSMQVNRWIAEDDISDRFNRFLILYGYACKALLRQQPLGDTVGDGASLVERGLLTENELKEIHDFPCWEPHYCLEVMRELVAKTYTIKGGFYLEEVKMHGQIYRCFDNSIKKLNDMIGDCINVQSSELPVAYDGIHLFTFYLYFTIAPIIWSLKMSWVVVPMTVMVAFVAIFLIIFGSKLVDPFGDDIVDIPLERFCETIEIQVNAISDRRRRGKLAEFAASEKPLTSQRPNLKDQKSFRRVFL